MEKVTKKYVIQRADGQFYYRKSVSSAWGFTDDFSKASLFESEKGAKSRLDIAGDGAIIREVAVGLPALGVVSIPSVWLEENKKTYPSQCTWCSFDPETGEYQHGEKYYDGGMNEITKDEYERLTKNPGN